METESGLVNRGNFLLVQEYLAYLLQVCLRNPKPVERYRFWLNHLLLWAMDVPLQRASSISTPFSDYVRSRNFAQENQKKIVETARAFLRWAKLYHEKQFSSLPAYRVEDLTPVRVQRTSINKYVRLEEVLKIGYKIPGKDNLALWRNQAMACLLFLSCARAGAAVSLPIQAVHLNDPHPNIEQKTELGMQTKLSKSATTFLHQIPKLLDFARGWDEFARRIFPNSICGMSPFNNVGGRQSTGALKAGKYRIGAPGKRFKLLSQILDFPYRPPHQYRHGYAVYDLERCKTMAEYHALSKLP